ncbi:MULTISPECIES: ATP synthase F0 subunit B [Streptomyces]|uniref:ATP synthase F0 subunit B n=1 Tax=Streptomyces virginiae TaxID=1961 RepID=A0ABZ1T2Y7_STRVG|nr:ATP synthase F0 subunit B [Streptomyces virginiae]
MAAEEPEVEPQDREAIEAYEGALATFTEKLNLLHISGGCPAYATVASASVRPRLTTTGLNEMLSGKRLPLLESLLEFVRIVTTPSGLDKPAAEKFRADPALVDQWRGYWQDVKLLQCRAQPANKRVRATVREVHDNALREAEALRHDAHAEAERIRTNAEADAERLREQARKDADGILERARETAAVPLPNGPDPQRVGRGVFRAALPTSTGRAQPRGRSRHAPPWPEAGCETRPSAGRHP